MSDSPLPKDPVSTAIEKGIEEAAETARHYMDKLCAPGLEEGGGLIQDTVAYWRFRNKVNLVLKAKAFLESKGIEPKKVLPKTAIPILEAGSLEGETDLADIWAAMLANAADPTRPGDVLPAYPRVLAELTALEVRILNDLYPADQRPHSHYSDHSINYFSVEHEYVISTEHSMLIVNNLDRLGLIESEISIDTQDLEDRFRNLEGPREHTRLNRWTGARIGGFRPRLEVKAETDKFTLTFFGADFIEACRRK